MELGIGSVYKNFYRLIDLPSERVSEFQERTRDVLGIYFPDQYVRQSNAYAFLDQECNMCGGLMVVKRPPFRCLQSIPEAFQSEALWKLGNLDECAEVNGVWIEPQNKSAFISTAFWRQMIDILWESQKEKFLFTVDHCNRHMLGHVAMLQPLILYSGATLQLDGMHQSADEVILSIPRTSIKAGADFLKRIDKGQKLPHDLQATHQIARRRNSKVVLAAFERSVSQSK